ncbi:hypothetical protein WA026_020015 [Henosepilachna vigintioctopunctata]|uniref:Uncharacterized protein n=1 Tax=Henosepilachna vigintioctopunctata TaxID=420089 RepID=A0AAW1V215_9CUCU
MEAATSGLEDFFDILLRINRKFEIIHATWSQQKSFEIKFRTVMNKHTDDYNCLCDEWVDTFSEVTNTVWAKKTSNTGPKVKFRKQYQCWTHGGKIIQKELLFDARKCKGTIDIKVFNENPSTRRKNKFVRLGLNVVVKINFIHLHVVDVTHPFAFFVHNCKPQLEVPKQLSTANERLPQLVAEMVQKGLNSSTATVIDERPNLIVLNNVIPEQAPAVENDKELITEKDLLVVSSEFQSNNHENINLRNDDCFIQEALQMNSIPTLQFVQNIPLQSLGGLKLEFQPGLEQFAQVVVSDSSLNESLLMCQPLMIDNMPTLPHFVQLNSRSLCDQNQGQFL